MFPIKLGEELQLNYSERDRRIERTTGGRNVSKNTRTDAFIKHA